MAPSPPSPPSSLTCPQRRLAHSSALLLHHLLLGCGRSHRSSGSVRPPTPAVGDQPRSCQVMLGVALPLPSLPIQPSVHVFPSLLLHTHMLFSHVSVCFGIYIFCIQESSDLLRLAPPFFDFYLQPPNICSLADCEISTCTIPSKKRNDVA